MGAPTLTDKEQKALNELTEICSKPDSKNYNAATCAIIKQQAIANFKTDEEVKHRVAAQNLSNLKLNATTYVISKVHEIMIQGILLSNALQKASGEYDSILGARASQPILGEILIGLALVVLPELKVVGHAANAFIEEGIIAERVTMKIIRANPTNWDKLGGEILAKTQKINDKITKFADFIDASGIDTVKAIQDPRKAAGDVDEETRQKLSNFQAKNSILTNLIKRIESKLVLISRLEPVLYQFIVWSQEDPLPFIKNLMQIASFDSNIIYPANLFDKFADFILYDMLKAYANQNCSTVIFDGKLELWQNIDGLDQAQRGMIYKKFGSANWPPISGLYPPINNGQELCMWWGVKLIEAAPVKFMIPTQ